jgi:hypothetical protein
MKIVRSGAVLALGALIASAALVPSGALAAKKAKLKVVGKDAAGDWGSNVAAEVGPAGDPVGQDLLAASIGANGKNIDFQIKVSSLPDNGGVPEGTRYTWIILVNGEQYELDGKWSNYTRGACDPTGNACPPPRDPGMQPFLIRGNCGSNGATVACQELGIVQATFDAAKGTITIPVPAKMIKAKPGTKIAAGTQADSGFSGVSAAPSAFYSHSAAPYDTLMPTKIYKVPGKK